MNFEAQAYNQLKNYLEDLGYPVSSIVPEYGKRDAKIDVVVKNRDKVLIAIEIKAQSYIKSITTDEIGYHPLTRSLQMAAIDLGAKYYLLTDGKQHIWLKTGKNGRPEKTIAITYSNFRANTLSNAEFTKELLAHIVDYIRHFPITGDHLFDTSVVLYSKLIQDKNGSSTLPVNLKEIIGNSHLDEKSPSSYSSQDILLSALERLGDINFLENRIAVLEYIDDFFEASRKEWNVPRWLADFMVSLIDRDRQVPLLDVFSRNGIVTSAACLRGYNNVRSYYTFQRELYWIKIQQLLGAIKESEIKFEPGLLKGDVEVLPIETIEAVLLAPPFNLKFDEFINSPLGKQGVKDGNILFLEAAFNAVKDKGIVVAIVPDGFLLSAQYLKARVYFNPVVESIISLPEGTFRPYSAVKASLLVLIKNSQKKNKKVFMALLDKIPEENSLYQGYDEDVKGILNNLFSFRAGKEIVQSEKGFVTDQLDNKDFHASKYWLNSQSEQSNYLQSGFAIIPLKEIVKSIERGSSIVSDAEGDIPCVNPATIRGLQLKKEDLSYTSTAKLPKGKIKQTSADEVLINMIGPYRGKAALVSKDFEGMLINRHVAAIKPNTKFILPGYLAIALNSNFVQEQFFDKTSGTVIPALNLASFENILLPVPDIEKQKEIYSEYASILIELSDHKAKASVLEGEINLKLEKLGKGGNNL